MSAALWTISVQHPFRQSCGHCSICLNASSRCRGVLVEATFEGLTFFICFKTCVCENLITKAQFLTAFQQKLGVLGPGGYCVTSCLLRHPKWSRDPSKERPLGRRRFFLRFCADLCVTPELLFFKRQNVEEISAENLRKNLRNSLALCTKNLRKICAQMCKNPLKNLRKIQCTKISAKNRAKNRRENAASPEDESQTKRICAKFAQKPRPKILRECSRNPHGSLKDTQST